MDVGAKDIIGILLLFQTRNDEIVIKESEDKDYKR